MAHPIFDPNMHHNQSVIVPLEPLACLFSRVFIHPDRDGFSSGNSISALTIALSNFDILTHYSHDVKHDCR